jgi:transcriptional regulator with XRE-family HTH domain
MLGSDLRELRQRKGLKAKELAQMLDINEATLSRYERGHRPIPKTVQYASQYLCSGGAGERLVEALKEALNHAHYPNAVRD